MKKFSRIVAAAVFVCVSTGVSMAQTTPSTEPETATTPAPAPTAPTPTAAAPAPVATAPATTTTEQTTKKKKPAKMTRQQEIDKSIDSGTVPARYRKSVPKEYQQYIPFAK
jgi:hypothetical protein